MRIAHITECLTDNGVSTVIRHLTDGFCEAGHEVDILTWRESEMEDPHLRKLNLPGLSTPRLSFLHVVLKALIGQRLFDYFNSSKIAESLQSQVDLSAYDGVLIHGLAAIPLWKLPEECIIVAHSTKSKMLLRARQLLLRPLLKYLYSRMYRAHQVICVSKGARDDLIEEFGADPERVTAIYNPFPFEEIRRKAQDAVDDVPDEYILAVGRPVKSKRFDRLMRVYRNSGIALPLVVMVGRGKQEKVLKLARHYGIEESVKVIGFRENPYPYMAGAKLLLLTSDYEGLPTVLIESLICGTPVLSTDCPSGPRELLSSEMPECLVPLADEGLFADKIKRFVVAPPVLKFDSEQQVGSQAIILKYLELLEKRKGS